MDEEEKRRDKLKVPKYMTEGWSEKLKDYFE